MYSDSSGLQCIVVQCSVVQCSEVQCSVVPCSEVQCPKLCSRVQLQHFNKTMKAALLRPLMSNAMKHFHREAFLGHREALPLEGPGKIFSSFLSHLFVG